MVVTQARADSAEARSYAIIVCLVVLLRFENPQFHTNFRAHKVFLVFKVVLALMVVLLVLLVGFCA